MAYKIIKQEDGSFIVKKKYIFIWLTAVVDIYDNDYKFDGIQDVIDWIKTDIKRKIKRKNKIIIIKEV